jgi:DNA-binding winged helix-turn-helix (wHTH) protein/Tol biopolymer transport system component
MNQGIQGARSGRSFRFGPFEFRPNAWELRRSGALRRLSPQPARILLILLSNPGEIVTREHLQQAVWGDDVTVDFELGLNRCIRQIRSALMDDPDNPRYIKTIPRIGYVFIALVDNDDQGTLPAEVATVVPETIVIQEFSDKPAVEEPDPTVASEPPSFYRRLPVWVSPRRLQLAAFLSAGLMAAIAFGGYLFEPDALPSITGYQKLSESPSIVIATSDFDRSVLADGTHVYFSVMSGAATSNIAQVAAAGGEASIIPTPITSPILFDSSRQNSELLVGGTAGGSLGDAPLWTQPVPSGSARRVGNLFAHGASWSPAEDRIVYAEGSSLKLSDTSGRDLGTIVQYDAQSGQVPYWPRWSPDEKQIRFSRFSRSQNSSSLWEVGVDGKDLHPLLSGTESRRDSCCGVWAPDGSFYVFTSLDGKRSDLWALLASANWRHPLRPAVRLIRLTAGPLSYTGPAFGADGRLFVIGNSARSELVRYDAGSHEFAPLVPGISALQADFSRDGQRIAFVAHDGSLWQSGADGTGRTPVSYPPFTAAQPRWSPDGSSLAYVGRDPGELDAVYLSQGAASPRRISLGAEHDSKDPDWSADGEQLVFADTSYPSLKATINIVDLKDGSIRALSSAEPVRSPRWSPDGRSISALSTDLKRLLVYDVSSKSWKQVASFRMGYPNWSHDGRYLYVVNLSSKPVVCRVRLSDSSVEQVVDMSQQPLYWTGDAWLGLTPDDAPLLSRDLSLRQILGVRLETSAATR